VADGCGAARRAVATAFWAGFVSVCEKNPAHNQHERLTPPSPNATNAPRPRERTALRTT